MRGRLTKQMVFHNQMCHFLGYALAPESRKSKTKLLHEIFNRKLGVCINTVGDCALIGRMLAQAWCHPKSKLMFETI